MRERGVSDSFGTHSNPYLMATEYPWLALEKKSLQEARVLSVGGSGDVPFFFCRQGAAHVAAVDVSAPACFLMELKEACLRELSWREFLRFFLAGIPRAETFLRATGTEPLLGPAARQEFFVRVMGSLRADCRQFWEEHLEAPPAGNNPFARFLRPTDLFGLHLIPYLNDPLSYSRWKGRAGNLSVMNLSLQDALDRLKGPWHLIYTSNIFEYLEMDHALGGGEDRYRHQLRAFAAQARECLCPEGRLCWYVYEHAESSTFRERLKGLQDIFANGWTLHTRSFEYRLHTACSTRFRNTLLVFQKS